MRLHRYVLAEILGPTVLGIVAFGMVLFMNLSLEAAEMAIRRDLTMDLVGQFLLLSVPRILVLALPMAVLVGVLVGLGRLTADNEIGALRALGLNDRRLVVPALVLGALAAGTTFWLYDQAVPAANYAQHQLQARIFLSTDLNREVQPRTFFEKIPDLLIYAETAAAADGTLEGVLLYQKDPRGVEEIASAGRARIEYQADRRALAFRLEDVISHSWDRSNPETYQVAHREEQKIIRPPDIFETEMLRALKEPPPRNLREQSVAQILRSIDESRTTIPKGPARRRFVNEARVELHKKFAIPGACAVFAVLGAGLALRQRRGGRAWGFVISLPVFALEYALLTAGEQFADRGRLPAWLAMWMGNIAFGLIGIGLLVAAPRGGWDPSALAARLRRRPEPPAAAPPEPPQTATPEPAPGGSDPPGRAVVDVRSRRRFGLPAVDAYLLRTLAPVFLLVASSLGLLFALFATLDLVDEVARWGRSLSLLLAYVANILPMFLVSYVLPVGLCASTLITFALLSRTHELTALRSAGLGPFRVSAAFLAVASAAAVGSFALLDSVLPAANQKALQVRDQIRGRSPRSYRQVERRWVFASRGDLVTYSEFSPERREILDLGLFRFKPGTFEIRNRLSAERAVWSAEGWILTNGWERSFEKGAESYAAFGRRILSDLDGPHYFTQEWKTPDQMNLRDLTAHTRDMQRRGHESLDLRVALHRKIAVPAVCVVLVLVALPFGLRLRGRGALVGLGIAVSLAAAFFFAMQACGKLGEVGILPPALAAWVPGAVFSGGGLYLMAWSRW